MFNEICLNHGIIHSKLFTIIQCFNLPVICISTYSGYVHTEKLSHENSVLLAVNKIVTIGP